MAISETRSIVIENDRGGDADGILHVRKFNVMDRVLRALVMLGLIWLLALISVLVPVAHFILVPSFLLAGPVVAFLRFRVTEVNERVTGACPTCGRQITLPLEADDRLPLWTYCPSAGDPIHLLDGADSRRLASGA